MKYLINLNEICVHFCVFEGEEFVSAISLLHSRDQWALKQILDKSGVAEFEICQGKIL